MPTRPARQQPHSPKSGAIPTEFLLAGGSLVPRVARELNSALDRQLAGFDLTAQQAVLLVLAARQRGSPSQLKDRLGPHTAGLTPPPGPGGGQGEAPPRPAPRPPAAPHIQPPPGG